MDVRKYLSLLALALFTVLAFHSSPAEACSCFPYHPQTHFCSADYVVLIRVLRKSHRLVANKVAYKVEIKKSYKKFNTEARKMLKHGRILTPDSETGGCGANLKIGKLYVIAGNAPHLDSCNYIKEYMKMSVEERRGFAGIYRKGCNCKVKPCFGNQCLRNRETSNACIWSPLAKCETDYSVCMPSTYSTPEGPIVKCHWLQTPAYKACLADP